MGGGDSSRDEPLRLHSLPEDPVARPEAEGQPPRSFLCSLSSFLQSPKEIGEMKSRSTQSFLISPEKEKLFFLKDSLFPQWRL